MFASGELQPWAEPPPEVNAQSSQSAIIWNPFDHDKVKCGFNGEASYEQTVYNTVSEFA